MVVSIASMMPPAERKRPLVDGAAQPGQQRDQHHQRRHERRLQQAAVLTAQRRVRRRHQQHHRNHAQRQHRQSPAQGAAIHVRRQVFVTVVGGPVGHARLGDAHRDQRHHGGDQHRGDHDEPVVARRRHHAVGLDDRRRLRGQAGEHRVHRAEQQVGAVAAGHRRERGGDAGQRRAAGQLEQKAGEGNQHHIAGVEGEARHHPGERHRHHQRAVRGAPHQRRQAGAQQAGMLGDAQPQHRHQHHAQRRETGEVGDHLAEQKGEAVAVEQRTHLNAAVLQRVRRGQPGRRQQRAQRQHQQTQPDEQQGGVRQAVAGAFQPGQPAGGRFSHSGSP